MQALNDDDLFRIINYESAYEICNILITTHEGTSQVKRAKIDLLTSQYEKFKMHENEAIDDMLTRFSKITNILITLDEPISKDNKVRDYSITSQIIGGQSNHFEGAERLQGDEFMSNLETHETQSSRRTRAIKRRRV